MVTYAEKLRAAKEAVAAAVAVVKEARKALKNLKKNRSKLRKRLGTKNSYEYYTIVHNL